MLKKLLSLCLLATSTISLAQEVEVGRTVFKYEGWPTIVELEKNEPYTIPVPWADTLRPFVVKVLNYREETMAYPWVDAGVEQKQEIPLKRMLELEIEGKKYKASFQPFGRPITCGPLQIYLEGSGISAFAGGIGELKGLRAAYRIGIRPANTAWIEDTLTFPVLDYKYRATALTESWATLVPYKKPALSRREFLPTIPNWYLVVSPINGTIVASPLPNGDGKLNTLAIKHRSGLIFSLQHLDMATLGDRFVVGQTIKAGDTLGYAGKWSAPELPLPERAGLGMRIEVNSELPLSGFPLLMQAYKNKYPNELIAILGEDQYVSPGESVEFEKELSIVPEGQELKTTNWLTIESEKRQITASSKRNYRQEGLYTELLEAITDKGKAWSYDQRQVRVWPKVTKMGSMGYGTLLTYPSRGLKAGQAMLLVVNLQNVKRPLKTNMGDGTKLKNIPLRLEHVYNKKGTYRITIDTEDFNGNPVVLATTVEVE